MSEKKLIVENDWCTSSDSSQILEYRRHACLLHDIFGNPFRPVTLDSTWITPNVVAIAQIIHEARAFDRLPALANALVEAGCDNPEILSHCHSKGPHVRGCWVVDLMLGKG